MTPTPWTPLIDDYMLTLAAAGQPQTTMKLRRIQLDRMARDLGCSPDEVTGTRLIEWFGGHPEWATETRRSYRAAVRCLFRWAYRTGRVATHLADELPTVREKRGAPRPAPDRVWRQALMAASPRVTLMLRLAAEAGLRRGEVAQVHTRDLLESIGGAQLLVHGKGGKQRIVPLGDQLAEAIAAGAAGHTPDTEVDGWLFPNGRGSHLSAYQVQSLLLSNRLDNSSVLRVLPDGYTMHTLRHRFASRAYRGTRTVHHVTGNRQRDRQRARLRDQARPG